MIDRKSTKLLLIFGLASSFVVACLYFNLHDWTVAVVGPFPRGSSTFTILYASDNGSYRAMPWYQSKLFVHAEPIIYNGALHQCTIGPDAAGYDVAHVQWHNSARYAVLAKTHNGEYMIWNMDSIAIRNPGFLQRILGSKTAVITLDKGPRQPSMKFLRQIGIRDAKLTDGP